MKIDSSNYIIKLLFGSTHIESPHHTLSIHVNLLYKDFSTISTLIPKTRKLKALKYVNQHIRNPCKMRTPCT